MTEFVIGSTNFGVDPNKSSFKLSTTPDGRVLLDIDIKGDQSTFDALDTAEEWEWSWTIYPPRFYCFTELGRVAKSQNLTMQFTADEIESAEMAIYLMNHNDVSDVILTICENTFTVSGNVDMMGQFAPFRIEWSQ